MAGKRNLHDWQRVEQELKGNQSISSGNLFQVLELSYSNLGDEKIKSCFLYCSLFPDEICCDQLVELWIGEGFLGEFDHIHEARNQGGDIIRRLQLANLLLDGMSEKYVRMHDIVRNVALRIAREVAREGKKVSVVQQEQVDMIKADQVEKWKEAQRISLWDCSVEELKESPSFLNLETLIVSCKLMSFPSGLFGYMPIIRVFFLINTYHKSSELV